MNPDFNASQMTRLGELEHNQDKLEALVNSRDWTTSPFGDPRSWSRALRTVAKLAFNSQFPMFLAWGPELGILYNDSYSAFLGVKHPSAFGSRIRDVWREIWPDIQPLIAQALQGHAVYKEDMPLVIQRNGRDEQIWCTFSYSPVHDDDEKIAGMYCVVTETTSRVLAERRQAFQLTMADTLRHLSTTDEIMEAASRLIGEQFRVGRVGYGEVDRTGKIVCVDRDWTNGTLASLAGESWQLASFGANLIDELRSGKTLRLDDITLDGRSAPYAEGYASIGARSVIVVPLLDANQLTAMLYLHEAAPRHWTDEEVTLVEDVARRTWEALKRSHTEEALRDETRILELLNQSGRIVASSLDLQVLLQSITDTSTQLSGAEFGAFFYNTTNEDGDAFMLYTLSGAPREAFEGFGHPRATALFGPTFNGAPAIRSDDIRADFRYGKWGPHHGMPPGHLPVRSYLAVPVTLRSGETIGGLFFGHSEVGIFTERVERLIVGIAAQAALGIDNARLYEQAQKAASEREALLVRERAGRTHAEQMNRMKDEFLAMLAHELRNPLAPIASAADLLGFLYKDDKRIRDASAVIGRQVTHLTRLVDDLLDVSRVTRGLVTLNNQLIDFRSCVTGAVDQVKHLFDSKLQLLNVQMPAESVYVTGDNTRLVQIIANILNNAAKYTEKQGRIDIHLEIKASALELRIRDNGSGMAAELVPNVFDLFTQGARTLARSQGGLGLGLALVKKLAELHGGYVTAHSAGIGKGSEFCVYLPISGQKVGESIELQTSGRLRIAHDVIRQLNSKVRVMVIDDNVDAGNGLKELLKVHGYAATVKYSAESALEQISIDGLPDVLLVDIGLPDINGYELARQLQKFPRSRSAKLIAVTGYGQAEDRIQSKEAGFTHHFVKPVDIDALIEIMEEIRPKQPIGG